MPESSKRSHLFKFPRGKDRDLATKVLWDSYLTRLSSNRLKSQQGSSGDSSCKSQPKNRFLDAFVHGRGVCTSSVLGAYTEMPCNTVARPLSQPLKEQSDRANRRYNQFASKCSGALRLCETINLVDCAIPSAGNSARLWHIRSRHCSHAESRCMLSCIVF